MKFAGKSIIITGAAHGIGAAIATKFVELGAHVIAADINADAVTELAHTIGAHPVACDVTSEADIQNLVRIATDRLGPIDIFCSNAGTAMGQPDHAASASNATWQTCWDLHVMSHVYAARAVLPHMISQKSGCLVQVSSAAGLISQIGDAAYSTTKHAAVGFAESLAIEHGDDGIQVHALCPQYVATPLLGYDDPSASDGHPGLLHPDEVAEELINGIIKNQFLILPHPETLMYLQHKSNNYDRWLGGMRKLRRSIIARFGGISLKDIHKLS